MSITAIPLHATRALVATINIGTRNGGQPHVMRTVHVFSGLADITRRATLRQKDDADRLVLRDEPVVERPAEE